MAIILNKFFGQLDKLLDKQTTRRRVILYRVKLGVFDRSDLFINKTEKWGR